MPSKWVVVSGMIAVAAVLAVPAWFVMRVLNALAEKRRAAAEAALDRAAEAEIAKVRQDLKYGRRTD